MAKSKFYEDPPEGMQAVLSNNKFVGYVKDSDDPDEKMQFAKDLLVEKGIYKEKSKEELMFDQARSFANTANYIYETDLIKLPRNPLGISPFVVNSAFSAEMYLKCLQQLTGTPMQTHTLTTLFKNLPNKLKDKINKTKKELEPKYDIENGILFKDHLKTMNNAFVDWRYIFEKESETINIPTVIIVVNILHNVTLQELRDKT